MSLPGAGDCLLDPVSDLLENAFLLGPVRLGELTLRPFSIGSLLLARRCPCAIVLDGLDGTASLERIEAELVRYAWLHAAPIPDVLQALRLGRQEPAIEDFGLQVDLLPHIPDLLRGLAAVPELIRAAEVRIVPKPDAGKKEKGEPAKLFEPGWQAQIIFTLASNLRWEEWFVEYHLPLPKALQYYHCALRAAGAWTVEPDGAGDSAAVLRGLEGGKLDALLDAARAGMTPGVEEEEEEGMYRMPGE